MQTFYLSPPATWPFKSPTIPAKLMPSRNSYTRNAQGLVLVDQTDLSTLLGLGFYLYGSTPNLNDFVSKLVNSGDATKYLNAVGALSTPAGGGSSGLVLVPAGSGVIASPSPPVVITLDPEPVMFVIIRRGWTLSAGDSFPYILSTDGGATYIYDRINADSYARTVLGGTGFDSLASPGLHAGPDSYSILLLSPGSSTYYPSSIHFQADNEDMISRTTVNRAATLAAPPARATTIKFFPSEMLEGNNLYPPESITGGSYWTYALMA